MSTNERYLERTARAWMRIEHMLPMFPGVDTTRSVLLDAALSFARAYGCCCGIGDAEEARETVERLRDFLARPNEPDEWSEETRWAAEWAKLRDGTLRED